MSLNTLNPRRQFASTAYQTGLGLLVIGGESSTSSTRHSSIALLKDQKWTSLANLSVPLSRHCSVLLENRDIYIIGGFQDKDPFSAKTIIFNFKSNNSYTMRSVMKTGRQLHSCAVIDGNKIIVVGGRNWKGSIKAVEVLYTSTQRWTEMKNLEFKTGFGYGNLLSLPVGECFIQIVCQLFTQSFCDGFKCLQFSKSCNNNIYNCFAK